MDFTLFQNSNAPKNENDISENVIHGDPKQTARLVYSGQDDTIKSGIWDSTAGVFNAMMQDQVEFCHILEGGATIKTEAGDTFTVNAGDAFVMENGLRTEWTVETYIKKHFVICAVSD